MDATISLRTFGPRNNWFFRHLQRFSIGSFRWIVLFLGISVLSLFIVQVASIGMALPPVQRSLDDLQVMQRFAQQASDSYLAIEQFMVANSATAFAQATQSLEVMTDAIEQMTRQSPPVDHYALSRLAQTSSDYQGAFRSLASMLLNGQTTGSQRAVHQEMVTTSALLEQQVSYLLQQRMAAANESVSTLSRLAVDRSIVLLLVLAILFSGSLVLVFTVTRHDAYALHQVGAAAGQLALEQYDTRIDVTGEANPDIVHLGMAINRLAETLQGALRSESAAQQQNQLQLLKLARQERKTAVLEERQRIARELHDSVKQQLFSMMLATSAAINLLDHAPDHVRTYLDHILQAGHQAQSEMTALVQELVPVSMQDKRLDEALHIYLSPLCEIHNIKLLWRVDGTNTLTLAQEHAVFRAVQEAVANVVRHSGATVLRVSINFGLVTHVIVEDNGSGFVPDAIPSTSTGLALMQTRLKRAGGHYELQTEPGSGTRLTILIDLRKAALVHP